MCKTKVAQKTLLAKVVVAITGLTGLTRAFGQVVKRVELQVAGRAIDQQDGGYILVWIGIQLMVLRQLQIHRFAAIFLAWW